MTVRVKKGLKKNEKFPESSSVENLFICLSFFAPK